MKKIILEYLLPLSVLVLFLFFITAEDPYAKLNLEVEGLYYSGESEERSYSWSVKAFLPPEYQLKRGQNNAETMTLSCNISRKKEYQELGKQWDSLDDATPMYIVARVVYRGSDYEEYDCQFYTMIDESLFRTEAAKQQLHRDNLATDYVSASIFGRYTLPAWFY